MDNKQQKAIDAINKLKNIGLSLPNVLTELTELANDSAGILPDEERKKLQRDIKNAKIGKTVKEFNKAIEQLQNIQSKH